MQMGNGAVDHSGIDMNATTLEQRAGAHRGFNNKCRKKMHPCKIRLERPSCPREPLERIASRADQARSA